MFGEYLPSLALCNGGIDEFECVNVRLAWLALESSDSLDSSDKPHGLQTGAVSPPEPPDALMSCRRAGGAEQPGHHPELVGTASQIGLLDTVPERADPLVPDFDLLTPLE